MCSSQRETKAASAFTRVDRRCSLQEQPADSLALYLQRGSEHIYEERREGSAWAHRGTVISGRKERGVKTTWDTSQVSSWWLSLVSSRGRTVAPTRCFGVCTPRHAGKGNVRPGHPLPWVCDNARRGSTLIWVSETFFFFLFGVRVR